MRVIHFKSYKKENSDIGIGIGKFDGVHIGHQSILNKVLCESQKDSLTPSVFTFRNFPNEFMLYSWEDRLTLIKKSGIKLCIWCDFQEVYKIEADTFLDILSEMGTKTIVVGYNFHFGAERKGDINFLQKNSVKYGYNLLLIPPQKKDGEIINSTKIRLSLKEGELNKVTDFLGRTFSIEGKVIHGDKIGGKLGFPTANLQLFNNIKISEGVYAGFVKHNNKLYSSAIYIGNSPTFEKNERKFEVYLFDFEKNLYDETLKVYLIQKVRGIKIFENESQLKTQIYSDIEKIKHITKTNKIIG
ncbi:riboflavin biosynthesis protein RibF [bacterium]|nr:riboflavin biosynthesis protein RibF [bacterium]